MSILITGAAGFIGFHVANKLLSENQDRLIIGIDNLNNYYDKDLKQSRLNELYLYKNFIFVEEDICNLNVLENIANIYDIKSIVHLAAQAGVRYSLEDPFSYIHSNIRGHLSILELCRKIKNFNRLIYASSSSVYGNNKKTPFAIVDSVVQPISLYAATKLSDELMSYTYSQLFGINSIGLRFFTVYGPWGRPDMATFSFTKNIIEDKPISLYNDGNMKRDFTYIKDIVDGIIATLDIKFTGHKIYNLGSSKSIELKYFVSVLEKIIGKSAIIEYAPLQDGDLIDTFADITESTEDLGFKPKIDIEMGITEFVVWYKKFYNINNIS